MGARRSFYHRESWQIHFSVYYDRGDILVPLIFQLSKSPLPKLQNFLLIYVSGVRIHPIPQCWTLRNWFRPRNQYPSIPAISFDSVIHGIPLDSVWTEFRELVGSGISGISLGRNSGNWMELIPQCSTSRNRMTALTC